MHPLVLVQERQAVEHRHQQFPDFLGTQRPLLQDLGERLFGIFHHDEEIFLAFELAPAHLEQPDQMRMGERGRRFPLCELRLRLRRIRPHELDRGVGKALRLVFGQVDGAMG